MTQPPSVPSEDGTKPKPTTSDHSTTPPVKPEPNLLRDGTVAFGGLWSFVLNHWRALSVASSLAVFLFGMWQAGIKVRRELIESNEALSPQITQLAAKLYELQLALEGHKAALDDQDSQLIKLLRRSVCDDSKGGSEAFCKKSLRKFHQLYVAQHEAKDHETCPEKAQKGSPCLQDRLKVALDAAEFSASADTEFSFSNAHLGKKAGLGLAVKGSMNMGDACLIITSARSVPGMNLGHLALSRGLYARQTILGMAASDLRRFARIRMTDDDWRELCDLAPDDTTGTDGDTQFEAAFKAFSDSHPERVLTPVTDSTSPPP